MQESIELAKRLEGLHTLETIQKALGVRRATAIRLMCQLRKAGLVTTSGGGKQPRWYRIATVPQQKIGSPGLYETINKYSPIKLAARAEHRIVGRELGVEEAIIRAINSKSLRVIIASLALFNHITDWSELYKLAREANVKRKVGALYDVARTAVRVRRMDGRIRSWLKISRESKFIIPRSKSKDFLSIQKEWSVFIPLNKSDLEAYAEWSR